MKLPQSITINFEPVDDGHFCHIDYRATYPCSDDELEDYLDYALQAVRAEGGKGE
jgi:hypothetical protein